MSEFEKVIDDNIKNKDIRTEKYKDGCIVSHFVSLSDVNSVFKDWQPPKKLVVVPQFVADWIELIKQRNRNVLTLLDSDDMPNDVYDWLFIKEDDENINLILLAWVKGYTVEKEKKYILKHIDLSKQYNYNFLYLSHGHNIELGHVRYSKDVDMSKIEQCHFTQSEIDKLNIGSYVQIRVKVEEVEK